MSVLESPESTLVGATDLAAMTTFLRHFDFEETATVQVPEAAARHLYGLDAATHGVRLAVPGASSGRLNIVVTPGAASHHGPTDQGAHQHGPATGRLEGAGGAAQGLLRQGGLAQARTQDVVDHPGGVPQQLGGDQHRHARHRRRG